MTTRPLASTHELTMQQAETILQRIAEATTRTVREEAKREAQVERAKDACDRATAEDRASVAGLEQRLTTFVLGHPELFRRPRMHRTPFGRFGLSSSTRCVIEDAEALIAHAKEAGYPDLFEVREKPIKKAVSARLRQGETLPGARLDPGENAKYEIDRAVLEQA